MPEVQGFKETLDRMLELHRKKNDDYAGPSNPFSNFDASEFGLRMFTNPRDQAFIWPIFTKLARLATLLNSGNTPNHESVTDSMVDIAVYCILWKCDIELNRSLKGSGSQIVDPLREDIPVKSEVALVEMIEVSNKLTLEHTIQFRDYLNGKIRDEENRV